jgi:hydroxyacylglutathione hydrolase
MLDFAHPINDPRGVPMAAEIHLFPCLKDNYGVLVHDPANGSTAAIDAPEAGAVEEALRVKNWRLTDILVTHHHGDHTGGIVELKERHACRVTAPRREAARIPAVDVTVREGDFVTVGTLVGRVLETPGHTAGHISYWFKSEKLAFVGDTLFSIGCGRLLEGTADMMWQSLLKLRNLPADTEIYCGHEYTAANVHFALTIEPNNAELRARADEVVKLCSAGRPTIPSTIAAEQATNPFLRADLPSVAAAVDLPDAPATQVFAAVRARKDKF